MDKVKEFSTGRLAVQNDINFEEISDFLYAKLRPFLALRKGSDLFELTAEVLENEDYNNTEI